MEHTTSVNDADEFDKGDVYSKSEEKGDTSDEQDYDNDADEFDKGDVYSKSEEEGDTSDEQDYDNDASDCSLSSDDDHRKDSLSCSQLAAAHIMVFEADDESVDTTWTDEKHSSYLDSMEATFVRKMYDKEYCSVDVCGHSSHSSVIVEQDCVESCPLYLNMRKPYKQDIGFLPVRTSTGSRNSTLSLLASPWIQHFKPKRVVLAKNSEAPDNSNGTERSGPYMLKKREALFAAADCNPSPRSSHGKSAGGFKKLKCEEDLSHMDMKMEEQYNAEQQIQESHRQDKALQSGQTKKPTKQEAAGFHEAGESEKIGTAVDSRKLASMPKEGIHSRDCNQLVPSSKDDGKEACGQSLVPDTTLSSEQGCVTCDIHVDKEANLFLREKVAAQLGSKTWTWDSRGRRHRVGEGSSSLNLKL